MPYDERFYVGPLGGLMALPNVQGQIDTPLQVIGGTHVSLTGAYTRDVFGFKRSWTWGYPLLTTRQAQFVEALQRDMVPGPLYLLDPRRPNRLPEQIASGGSLLRTPDSFIPSNTAYCTWDAFSTISTGDHSTLPAAPLLRGAINLAPLAPGAVGLELGGDAADGRLSIPVIPGETVNVTAWVLGPDTSLTTMTASACTAGKVQLATTATAPVTPNQTSWSVLNLPVTVPATAAYLRVRFDQTVAGATNSSWLTALQVAPPEADVPGLFVAHDADNTDLTGGWRLGGGAPQVVPDVGSSSYAYPGLHAMGLTLTER